MRILLDASVIVLLGQRGSDGKVQRRHPDCDIPVLRRGVKSDATFRKKYFRKKPVVLSGLMTNWSAMVSPGPWDEDQSQNAYTIPPPLCFVSCRKKLSIRQVEVHCILRGQTLNEAAVPSEPIWSSR